MKCPCEKGICQSVTLDDSGVSAVKPKYVEDFCIYTLNSANAAIFSRSLSRAIPDSHQRQNTCANRCALFCAYTCARCSYLSFVRCAKFLSESFFCDGIVKITHIFSSYYFNLFVRFNGFIFNAISHKPYN